MRRKPLIECPGWLECSETGVESLCWWWVYTKLTSSTYNVRSVTIKPCRVLSFLITCICMLKNLTPCKLWFLTSCKVSNDVYIPKKPQQQQEKWLFPHSNESIYAYRDGKKLWSCKLKLSLPLPTSGADTERTPHPLTYFCTSPIRLLHLPMLPSTNFRLNSLFIFNIKREMGVIIHWIKVSLNACLHLEPFWKRLCVLYPKLFK